MNAVWGWFQYSRRRGGFNNLDERGGYLAWRASTWVFNCFQSLGSSGIIKCLKVSQAAPGHLPSSLSFAHYKTAEFWVCHFTHSTTHALLSLSLEYLPTIPEVILHLLCCWVAHAWLSFPFNYLQCLFSIPTPGNYISHSFCSVLFVKDQLV